MPTNKVICVAGNMKLMLDVTAYVKWENRAAAEGKSVSQLLSIFLAKLGTTNP